MSISNIAAKYFGNYPVNQELLDAFSGLLVCFEQLDEQTGSLKVGIDRQHLDFIHLLQYSQPPTNFEFEPFLKGQMYVPISRLCDAIRGMGSSTHHIELCGLVRALVILESELKHESEFLVIQAEFSRVFELVYALINSGFQTRNLISLNSSSISNERFSVLIEGRLLLESELPFIQDFFGMNHMRSIINWQGSVASFCAFAIEHERYVLSKKILAGISRISKEFYQIRFCRKLNFLEKYNTNCSLGLEHSKKVSYADKKVIREFYQSLIA